MEAIEVLVIEDNPLMISLLEVTFRRDHRMHAEFCTGAAQDALDMARRQRPDVIVLDYLIDGDLTGPQLAPLLKVAAPGARIVLFTGSVDRDEAARTTHIDAALDKLQLKELLPTVRRLAGITAAEDQSGSGPL